MKNSCVKNRTLESMVIIFMECFTLKKVKRWKKPIIRIMPKNNNNSGGKKLAHKYEPAKVILKWNKQRMNVKNIICLKENILQCIDYSNEIQDKNNQFLNLYYNYVSYQYMTFLVCCHFVKDKNIKNELYEMKKYSYLLNYDKNKKVKVFKIINNIFGYKFLYFAIEIYLKLRKR